MAKLVGIFKLLPVYFLTSTTQDPNEYIDPENKQLKQLQDKFSRFGDVVIEVLTWGGLSIAFIIFLFNFIKFLLASDNAHQKEQAKSNLKLPLIVMVGILTARLIWEAIMSYFV